MSEAKPSGQARPDAPRRDVVWEVFARQAYEEPLHHVGTIREADEELAKVNARAVYDEQPWVHMVMVPRTEIREVIAA